MPPYPPVRTLRRAVLTARAGGLDSLFTYDHLQELHPRALWDERYSFLARRMPSPHALFEYQTLLGAVAAWAGRLQLGIGVTEPVRRHPVVLAQAALTLAHLCRRAPVLGIGSGERMNTEPYGLPLGPAVARLEEALQVVRLCLAGGPVDFAGTHYRLDRAVFDLPAPPGRTPLVWVAAHGPRMLDLTGRYADGWLPVMLAPEQYRDGLARVRTAAVAAGRDPDAVTPALVAYVAFGRDERAARRLVDSRLLRYLSLMLPAARWREVGAEHPFGPGCRGSLDVVPERHDRAALEAALAAVPPEVVRRAVTIGTPDQVADRLLEFGDAGLRHVLLAPFSALLGRADYELVTPWALRRVARALRGRAPHRTTRRRTG